MRRPNRQPYRGRLTRRGGNERNNGRGHSGTARRKRHTTVMFHLKRPRNISTLPIATLPQKFMSAMPRKRTNPNRREGPEGEVPKHASNVGSRGNCGRDVLALSL